MTRIGIPGMPITFPHICGSDIVGSLEGDYDQLPRRTRVLVYPGISCNHCDNCRNGNETICRDFSIIGGLSNYNGGYAEYVVVPKTNIVPIPDEISDEQAATLSISYLTAWNIFKKLQLKKDDTLLVYGATGGLGMAVIQIAKALGIKIITSVSDDSKFNFARSLGSDNEKKKKKKEVVLEVEKITRGLGGMFVDSSPKTCTVLTVSKGWKMHYAVPHRKLQFKLTLFKQISYLHFMAKSELLALLNCH